MSSFTALRNSFKRAAAGAALPKSKPSSSTFRRFNSTNATPPPPPPPAAKSSTGLYVGIGAVLAAGGVAYYLFDGAGQAEQIIAARKTKFVPTQEDYQKVYNKIAEVIEEAGDAGYDDGSYGPLLLRLAWHASGTYDAQTKTGGSNYATMRFNPESEHGANAGLNLARDLMNKVKKDFDWISYGDLWTLAGVAAVQEMAGPKIPWRAGREDGFEIHATPDGRLPDATQGSDHLRAIFYRMGFNDQEIVALSGAHALGRGHTDRSGFDGPWTFSPTTLTNDFYKLLFDEKWVWKKWSGPKQYTDKGTGTLMMLPTDYVLVQDKSFKKHAKAYADDNDLFFKDFSKVVATLFELGVPTEQFKSEPWALKTLEEQK